MSDEFCNGHDEDCNCDECTFIPDGCYECGIYDVKINDQSLCKLCETEQKAQRLLMMGNDQMRRQFNAAGKSLRSFFGVEREHVERMIEYAKENQ